MFVIYTILSLLGSASLVWMFYCLIQHGQLFDILFKWQNFLRKMDIKGTFKGLVLYKILGGCELCFAHFVSVILFIPYCFIMLQFSFDQLILSKWYFWIFWYLVYVPINTNLSLFFIKKLYAK